MRLTRWFFVLNAVALLFGMSAAFSPVARADASLNWGQVATGGPAPRGCAAMTFDAARARSVLFGGYDGVTDYGDTWEWASGQWVLVATQGPPARACAGLAFDAAEGRSVLYGGQSNCCGYLARSSDTWLWDGSTWQLVSSVSAPGPRDSSGMAYDAGRGRVVMFGGWGASGALNDTWEWDGTTWSQVATTNAPSPRFGLQMAYDSSIGKTILFGGASNDQTGTTTFYNDTWEYDGSNWSLITPPSPIAPAAYGAMDFDAQAGHTVLFGGYSGGSYINGTTYWFDAVNSTWSQPTMTNAPGGRARSSMAYDSASGVSRLFGGNTDNAYQNDTWETPASPVATLTPTTVDFGLVPLGTTSQAQSATISNTGTAKLHISSVELAGSSPFAKTTDTCSNNVLAPHATCTVSFTFSPIFAQLVTWPVRVYDDSNSSPQTLTLAGTGQGPAVALQNAQLAFGNRTVNTTSPMTLVLDNPGNMDAHVSTLAMQGGNASEFSITQNACTGATVSPGASCNFVLNFTPASMGSKSANLVITDDANNSPQTYLVSGFGVEGIATLAPASLDFGRLAVGVASTPSTISVTNTGNDTMSIGSAGITSDQVNFAVSSDTCTGASLTPGASCAIAVVFHPQAYGTFTTSVAVASDAGNGYQYVGLTGVGLAGHPAFNPSSVNFGTVKVNKVAPLQSVTVTNVGNATLHIGTLRIQGGSSPSDFYKLSDTCSGTGLQPGSSCSLTLAFRPRTAAQEYSALSFPDDDPAGPSSIYLVGIGVRG